MLCIGFGKWPPQNTTEVWITIISMLIGASLYAMFIGHISTLIHSVNSASRDYNEKVQTLLLRKLTRPVCTPFSAVETSGRVYALQKATH